MRESKEKSFYFFRSSPTSFAGLRDMEILYDLDMLG